MAVQDYKINYKSDFVLNINGDAGWATQFCIKFWTGMPSQAYFVGFDGVKYVNCRVGDTPTQLLVMFDDHHLPIGKLKMQIAYHTTIEEFPGSVFDEVTNARDVIVTIDGTDYQVLLDFTGEDTPELEFDLPAYANEAERIQNELQRQQNEADRIAAELQREQATAAAVQGAENVNAQLNGTTLTVTNRQGVSTSVNTKGEQGAQGPVGPEGPQGEQGPQGEKGDTGATGPQGSTGPQGPKGDTGVSITDFVKTGETETDTLYDIEFSDDTTKPVAIPKGEKGDQGEQGPEGPQGPMGDVAVITPEQQAAFTMYSTTGQNTNGPMTQKAVTDALGNIAASGVSYDNSQSGLAATDVQDAIDEVADNITDKLILGTLSYGSSYSNTEFHLKAGHTYHFEVALASGTTNTSVVVRASDGTTNIAAFNTANFGTSFSWKCTQGSTYLRSANCSVNVYEVVNKAESQFVKIADIGDFIKGSFLINTTSKKWESPNSTHNYIQVKDGWKTIDVTANANVRTSLVFTTNHSPSNRASVGVCDSGIYSIPAGTSLNSIAIPSDCAFICLTAWNANANLDMTPSSLIVNGDVDTRFNDVSEDIESNTGMIEGISELLMTELGKVVCSSAGYENLSFPLNQGNLYRITFTPTVTGSLRIINTDSTYTEIWPSTMDEAIFLYQAEVDSIGFRVGGVGTTVKVESMVNVGNIVDDIPTVKYIKSDGSGDYTSIQQAINDITDASPTKKYELRVCDDESYTSATQLWLVSSPSSHADSASSPAVCASIITKDYINIVGWNRRRKVSVRLADIGTAYVKNVVAMHLQGNVVVDNMDFEVENCRYAIHQESGGNAASLDYHATTELRNCDVTHLGGVKCTTWTSTYAQANGACHGLHCIYKNVKWYPGYYMHSNLNFDAPVKAEYYNCSIAQKGTDDILNPTLGLPYVGNNGQGHRVRIHAEGCSMLAMYGKTGMMDNNTIENAAHDFRTQLPIISGHGNAPMVLMPMKPDVLAVKSVNSNVNVTAVGGSAAADIFGEVWKSYAGTADKYGTMLGSEAIQQRGTTYNYTLAYRLGNCASSTKTLTITVGGTTESATLDKDFKTNRATYTDAAIVNYINSQLTNCQVVLAASNADFIEAEPWDDCKEMVVNADTRTMMYGMAVRKMAGNQWVICDSGDVPQGVVCERINPNGYGKVAILDKSIFTDLYGVNATVGQRIIPADGGAWTVNSNGLLKAVSNNAYQIG